MNMNAERIKQLLPYIVRRTVQQQSPIATLLEIMSSFHEPVEFILNNINVLLDPRRLDGNMLSASFINKATNLDALDESQLADSFQHIVKMIEELQEAPENGETQNRTLQVLSVNARRSMLLFLAHCVDLLRVLASPNRPPTTEGNEKHVLAVDDDRAREMIATAHWFSKWRGTEQCLIKFLEMMTGLQGFTITVTEPFHVVIKTPPIVWEQPELMQLAVRVIEEEKPAHVTYQLE